MKRALAVLLLVGCSSAPRYQVSTGADGSTTRIETQTGKTEILVRAPDGSTKWVAVGEKPTTKPVIDAAGRAILEGTAER